MTDTIDPARAVAERPSLRAGLYELDSRLGEQESALGKLDLAGYNSLPTFMDPDSTQFDDAGWWQVDYSGGVTLRAGALFGQTAPLLDLEDSDGTSRATITFDQRGPGQNSVSLDLHTSSRLDLYAGDDGSQVTANGPLTGFVDFYAFGADGGGASLRIAAETGQTDPLLDLQDSGGNSVLEVTGDNKIGFYNKAPAALQTGVAVSAPGIHAALVALGLITA